MRPTTFALFIGNRGMFPAQLLEEARLEVTSRLDELGYGYIIPDAGWTRHGAVETLAEGQLFADFLVANRGRFDGVIAVLPNFGDEKGALAALQGAGVPILIVAYPDELDKMANATRRDAFCGVLSVCDVLRQARVPYTVYEPHVVHPNSQDFADNVDQFARVCQTVRAMVGLRIGAIGARTSPFMTVRCDEGTLQGNGITVETDDLSTVFTRMDGCGPNHARYGDKLSTLQGYACFGDTPREKIDMLVRLGLVLDEIITEKQLDAIALRCWTEMQTILGISPCILLSELNERGIVAACEVDVANAVAMVALSAASGNPATLLDWNNNHGGDPDRCHLFHCGPVPASMMTGPGKIEQHAILANLPDVHSSWGCNTGRIRPMPMTYASMNTEDGELKWYIGEGSFTADEVPAESFGCAGVALIPDLQGVLLHLRQQGFRHHVAVTEGNVMAAVAEAFDTYLDFGEVTLFPYDW